MWMSDVEMNVWIRGRGGVAHRVPRCVDVRDVRARKARDHRGGIDDAARDLLHGFEVAGRGDRETGLDHVDAQARELLGDLQLLLRVQRDPRRLLAVAQRRVEDDYSVGVFRLRHGAPLMLESSLLLGVGLAATCGRRRAIPPEGGGEEVEGRVRAPSARADYQPRRRRVTGSRMRRASSAPTPNPLRTSRRRPGRARPCPRSAARR